MQSHVYPTHAVPSPRRSARYDHDRSESYSSQASDLSYDYLSPVLPSPASFPSPSPSTDSESPTFSNPLLASPTPSRQLRSPGHSTQTSDPWARQSLSSELSLDESELDVDFDDYDYASTRDSFQSDVFEPTMPLFSTIADMLSQTSSSPHASSIPLPLPASVDRCFCGKAADTAEDSIYCSVKCARKDAINALCGVDEDTTSTSGGSHYRRVEFKREEDRTREEEREKARGRSRMGTWRFGAGSSSPSVGPTSYTSTPTRVLPPRYDSRSESSSSHASIPSLSSSIASYETSDSSLAGPSSPLAPSFFPSTPPPSSYFLLASSPQPTLCPHISNEDIYASYLTATPTLCGTASPAPSSPFKSLSLGGNVNFDGGIGPGYASEEERDRVGSGIGYAGQELKERVKERMPKHGHHKAKLSFENVVAIMNS